MPGIGWCFLERRRLLRFDSWLQETTNFTIIVKIEAMRCPWVIISIGGLWSQDGLYEYYTRGHHCSFYYDGLWSASWSRMSNSMAPVFYS